MIILLDIFSDITDKVHTTDLEIHTSTGRLEFYMSDGCDNVSGFFRSKEDIENLRDELNKYLEGLNESMATKERD